MTWSRFDDGYDEHEKVQEAWHCAPAAVGLHAMAITMCARRQTNGVIPVRWIAQMLPAARVRNASVRALVDVGLFDILAAGDIAELENPRGGTVTVGPFPEDRYLVHDFLEYNPSTVEVERNREWDRRRKELHRDHGLVEEIRKRDKDRCRYCGILVNWKDRRGKNGGTYDHVIPRGPNTLENVVVACRGCNMRKQDRTPEMARMPLLAPGSHGVSAPVDLDPIQTGSSSRSRSVQATRPDPTRPNREASPPVAASGDAVAGVWDAYVETRTTVLGPRSAPTLTAARRRLITARLKEYDAADLVDAVRGWRHSPHNRGENDRGRPFCDLELVLRDAGHIETFRDMERAKSQPAGATVADLAARINAAHESEAAA